jgi:hypothetical protein
MIISLPYEPLYLINDREKKVENKLIINMSK